MIRSWNIALAMLFIVFTVVVASADIDVKLSGEIHTQWYYDLSDSLDALGNRSDVQFDSYNHFDVTRAYITSKAKMSEKTYGKITVDVEPTVNVIRLKYGYVGWRLYETGRLKMGGKLGLVETPYIYKMDKEWGRRYVSMTPVEYFQMQSSADYGISFYGKIGEDAKWAKAFLSLLSGTGYDNPGENNPTKDIDFTVFATPLNGQPDFEESKVGLQFNTGKVNAYADSSQDADTYKKTLISFMGDLKYRKLFNVGFEYNSYKSPYILDVLDLIPVNIATDSSDFKVKSLSIFGGIWFGELMPDTKALKDIDLYFRYIMLDPDASNHDNIGLGEEYKVKANEMIIGLECKPTEGVMSSISYQADKFKDLGTGVSDVSNSYLYVNMGLKF